MTYWKEYLEKPGLTTPIGVKSSTATLNYPIDFSAWLTNLTGTYVSHTVSTVGSIQILSNTYNSGIITLVISGGKVGEKTSFTINIVASVAGTTIKDSRTFLLDIISR